jgi:glycosyltransferase involved in cell wall biosynthesis
LKYGLLKNRLVSLVELGPTRRYEAQLLQSGGFKAFCATSQEDAQALEELAGLPKGQVQVIPNGVDLDYFSPPASLTARQPDTVVFSGKLSYHANIAAARYLVREIWPLIRQARPQARLLLVGNRPPADLLKLTGQDGIEVTGYVADIRTYLQSATVAAAPMVYSVGIQNKVLEAMACATPVVATGDIKRGVNAQDGRDLYLVPPAQPQEFARRVIELLQNPATAAQMGNAGRLNVVKHYSWQKAAELVEKWWLEAQTQTQDQTHDQHRVQAQAQALSQKTLGR